MALVRDVPRVDSLELDSEVRHMRRHGSVNRCILEMSKRKRLGVDVAKPFGDLLKVVDVLPKNRLFVYFDVGIAGHDL